MAKAKKARTMTANNPTHEVAVCKAGTGYMVCPDHVFAKPGDRVRWANLTGDEVIVCMPHGRLCAGGEFMEAIDPGRSSTTKTIAKRPSRGHHPYAVYCAEGRDFAVGGSHPDIICG